MPKVVVYVRARDWRTLEASLPLDQSPQQWVREQVAEAIAELRMSEPLHVRLARATETSRSRGEQSG